VRAALVGRTGNRATRGPAVIQELPLSSGTHGWRPALNWVRARCQATARPPPSVTCGIATMPVWPSTLQTRRRPMASACAGLPLSLARKQLRPWCSPAASSVSCPTTMQPASWPKVHAARGYRGLHLRRRVCCRYPPLASPNSRRGTPCPVSGRSARAGTVMVGSGAEWDECRSRRCASRVVALT
jgi:hypothetical protein